MNGNLIMYLIALPVIRLEEVDIYVLQIVIVKDKVILKKVKSI